MLHLKQEGNSKAEDFNKRRKFKKDYEKVRVGQRRVEEISLILYTKDRVRSLPKGGSFKYKIKL